MAEGLDFIAAFILHPTSSLSLCMCVCVCEREIVRVFGIIFHEEFFFFFINLEAKFNIHILYTWFVSFVHLQQSHEVLISLYEDMASGRFTPSFASGSLNSRMEEDKQLINQLLLHFCASGNSAPKCKVLA